MLDKQTRCADDNFKDDNRHGVMTIHYLLGPRGGMGGIRTVPPSQMYRKT